MQAIILPEIIAAGIYNSRNVYKNKAFSKKRTTTMFEIEMPVDNEGVSFIDDDNCPVNVNTLICVKPNQIRHAILPFTCYYIHFQSTSGILFDKLMNFPNFIPVTNNEYYLRIFKKIMQYNNGGSDSDYIIVQSLILDLIYNLEKESKKLINKKNATSSNEEIVDRVIKYIKNNITEDLSLAGISKHISLSPIYLHNLFKASTGKTLRDFVEEQRIRKAINLLTSTNYTLTKIAYECGFFSQSYFSYVFKQKMKTTPREYVKKVYGQYDV